MNRREIHEACGTLLKDCTELINKSKYGKYGGITKLASDINLNRKAVQWALSGDRTGPIIKMDLDRIKNYLTITNQSEKPGV